MDTNKTEVKTPANNIKELFESGRFYGNHDGKVVGQVIDQSTIFADLNNKQFQDNADKAIHRFIK